MIFIYNIFIFAYGIIAKVLALFRNKAKLFVDGRKNIFYLLEHDLTKDKRNKAWFHVSSLGEFEQALPLIEAFKKKWPKYSIVLSFFSPSGYEVRKNHPCADFIFYLPLDTPKNAEKWIAGIQPKIAFFAKYDLWYHYLKTLNNNKIPTYLFSAVFQKRQVFFKWYGSLHRQMLQFFDFIFVQDAYSVKLLKRINIKNVLNVGDTRIDRVIKIRKNKEKRFPTIISFKGSKKLLIVGSAWKYDWQLILEAYTNLQDNYRLLIAPHEIDEDTIKKITEDATPFKVGRYTDWEEDADIMVLDTIGMLNKIYRWADVVWIGGGFQRSGIHNILEPAVYGIPIFFGPNYKKFIEANLLIKEGGAAAIESYEELLSFIYKPIHLQQMSDNTRQFIERNAGATSKIIDYLKSEKNFSSVE